MVLIVVDLQVANIFHSKLPKAHTFSSPPRIYPPTLLSSLLSVTVAQLMSVESPWVLYISHYWRPREPYRLYYFFPSRVVRHTPHTPCSTPFHPSPLGTIFLQFSIIKGPFASIFALDTFTFPLDHSPRRSYLQSICADSRDIPPPLNLRFETRMSTI